MHLDINDIMKMIPHGYPFLLIDKVIELHRKEKIIAIKNVTINEHFFTGHFPGKPIMPGVLIVEAMAQSCAVCAIASLGDDFNGRSVYFTGINDAKFRKPVVPGDVLHIHATVTRIRSLFWMFECKAINQEDRVTTEAKITATIDQDQG
ncbi:MAG: 3-hydroxyacyl-ACP dehydratase FabZ [Rickettsiaceae bacterium H1]|nr:3-hydroxyacyl-ACP dehydratase FabZ [Rickettsiaceae bacterium H1]